MIVRSRFPLSRAWLVSLCVALCLCGFAANSDAQNKTTTIKKPRRCRVKWNLRVLLDYKQAKMSTVVRWIAKQTCQNFILSDRVRGQPLNIISATRVTVREAYRAFFAALQANQMTAYRVGASGRIAVTSCGAVSSVVRKKNPKICKKNSKISQKNSTISKKNSN